MMVGKVQTYKYPRLHLHDQQRVHSIALLCPGFSLIVLEVCSHAWNQGVGAWLELVVSYPLTQAKEPCGLYSEAKLHEVVHHYEALVHCCHQ